MAELRCPDCAATLQVLFVERGGGKPDVQLDRCPQCAGLWFDAGELEQALAKSLREDALGAPTDRRCPHCTTTMETVLLPGAVPAETCASCRGVWLDPGELEELGGAEPRKRQAAPATGRNEAAPRQPPPGHRPTHAGAAVAGAAGAGAGRQGEGVSSADFEGELDFEDGAEAADAPVSGGFECARCSSRTPFSDAHGTAHGLVCGRCTPQVQQMPPAPDIEIATRRNPYGRGRQITAFDIKDLSLTRLFRYFG